jgi:hypothetical protein
MTEQNSFVVTSTRAKEEEEDLNSFSRKPENPTTNRKPVLEGQERAVYAQKSRMQKNAPIRASDATTIDETQIFLKRNFQRAMRLAFENSDDVKKV